MQASLFHFKLQCTQHVFKISFEESIKKQSWSHVEYIDLPWSRAQGEQVSISEWKLTSIREDSLLKIIATFNEQP